MHTHAHSAFDNCVTLNFDLLLVLTFGSAHATPLPCTDDLCQSSLVFIALAVFRSAQMPCPVKWIHIINVATTDGARNVTKLKDFANCRLGFKQLAIIGLVSSQRRRLQRWRRPTSVMYGRSLMTIADTPTNASEIYRWQQLLSISRLSKWIISSTTRVSVTFISNNQIWR